MATLARLKLLQRYHPLLLSSNSKSLPLKLWPRCCNTLGPRNKIIVFPSCSKEAIYYKLQHRNLVQSRREKRSGLVSSADFFKDNSESPSRGQGQSKRDLRLLLQQFNDENRYVHRHVQTKLADLPELDRQIGSREIMSLVDRLDEFAHAEHLDEQSYKDTRSEYFKLSRNHIKQTSLKNLAILMSHIKDRKKGELRVIKKMIDVDLKSRLGRIKRKLTTNELDTLLYIADMSFQCNAMTTFTSDLIRRLTLREDESLNDEQLMYMLFIVILERDDYGFLSRHEQRLFKLLDKPALDDLVLICLSYFKTKKPLANQKMLELIIERLLCMLPTIDHLEPPYCAIIKSIRYSRYSKELKARDSVKKLITKVTQDPSCFEILDTHYNMTQTAKLMEVYRIYDQQMLDRLRLSIFQNSDEFRIKDIQYILSTLSNFKWNDLKLDGSFKQDLDSLCRTIVSEVRPDVSFIHAHLFPILRSFAIFGYYNDEIINYANSTLKDEKTLNEMIGNVLELDRTFLLLYAATRIESRGSKLEASAQLLSLMSSSIKRSGSTGSLRKDPTFEHLNSLLKGNSQDEYMTSTSKMRSIAKTLSEMDELNAPDLHHSFQFTLAHQNYADLVISLDRPAPGQFNAKTMMPKEMGTGEKHCLVFAIRDTDFMDGCDRLCGYKELIMRLLMKVGYHVVVVNLDKPDIVGLASQIRSVLRDRDVKLFSDKL